MFCANCGAQVPEGHRFCEKCGAPINPGAINVFSTPEAADYTRSNVAAASNKKLKSWPIVLVACLGLITLIASGIFAVVGVKKFIRSRHEASAPFYYDDDNFSFGYSSGFSYDPDNGFSFDFDEDYPIEDFDDNFDVDGFIEDYMDDFDPDYSYDEYSYATAVVYDDCMYLEGKGVINDNTVIYTDKTIGGFCDYVEKEVLEDGRKLDRRLLYSLLEVHLVDDSYYKGDNNAAYFEQTMMYCMMFANEFPDMNMKLDSCMYYTDEPTTYYYVLDIGEKSDTWTVDYNKKEIYMNDGKTEYKSAGEYSMFSDKTKMTWMIAIDKYFGIQ